MNRRTSFAVLLASLWCILQLSLLAGPAAAGSTATFNTPDTTTKGNWQGAYGSDGSYLATISQNNPSYATLTTQGLVTYVWNPSTTDPRALQQGSSTTSRIASVYYASPSFTLDLNLSGDSLTHQLALYFLDWDGAGRAETITITDPSTLQVLDTRTVSSFLGGQYLIWNVKGHVLIQFTRTAGPNAVVSGVFLAP